MITISLCMIMKNEEKTLPNCLDSVRDIVEEIIIVDTGSTDRSKEIAKRYTNHIYDFAWTDDFGAARNASFHYATQEYILWLDADDVLLEEARQKLTLLKQTLDPSVDAVSMKYHYAFDEYGNVSLSFRRNRLVKRSKGFRWVGAVHEYLDVDCPSFPSDIAVTHRRVRSHSDRNLRIYENLLKTGADLSPRDRFYYANELRDHRHFEKAIEQYLAFLQTEEGWVEDEISACANLADCYHQTGDRANELRYTLKSFEYDVPRAEFCCRLGYAFMQRSEYRKAIFWYRLATELPRPQNDSGFSREACWTWLPHVQLCVCYDRLGEYQKSREHHEIALRYRPDDKAILANQAFFDSDERR